MKPWNYNKIEKICLICKKEFLVSPCYKNSKFCSTKCYGKFLKGKPAWNKGLKKWWITSSEFKKGQIPWNKGTHIQTNNALKRFFENGGHSWSKGLKLPQFSGKNHPNWKGGITLLYNKIYASFEYKLWRSDVFKRDWYTCQKCEAKRNLRPHHVKTVKEIIAEYNIKTFKEALECIELWNINNGLTLCQKCHNKIHLINNKRIV